MYRRLRVIRIIVSAAMLLLLTLGCIDSAFAVTPLGRFASRTQLIPAILLGSMPWVVLWVVVTLTFGRVYCSTVCPLGTVQDCAARLGHINGRHGRLPYRYAPPINVIRFTVPVLVAVCLFIGLTTIVKATDPYGIYARMVDAVQRPAQIVVGSLAFSVVLVITVAAVAWRNGRLMCNTVCPAGGLLSLLGRQPIYRIDINTDKCLHCGRCEDVCKSQCINLRDCTVDNSRCVVCFDCTAVCPNSAITLRRGRYRLSTPLMMPTSLQTAKMTKTDTK